MQFLRRMLHGFQIQMAPMHMRFLKRDIHEEIYLESQCQVIKKNKLGVAQLNLQFVFSNEKKAKWILVVYWKDSSRKKRISFGGRKP